MAPLAENPGQQPEQIQPKLGLSDRVDQYWLEKNAWKKMNGGCPVTPDVTATLKNLTESVNPRNENLAILVRASVESNDAQGRPLEQVWAEKIAQGANYVGVLDGVFHFFKGEEILPETNKPLHISALPAMMEFRENDPRKQAIRDRARTEMAALRANFQSEFTNFVGNAVPQEVAKENPPAPYVPEGTVTVGGGSENA